MKIRSKFALDNFCRAVSKTSIAEMSSPTLNNNKYEGGRQSQIEPQANAEQTQPNPTIKLADEPEVITLNGKNEDAETEPYNVCFWESICKEFQLKYQGYNIDKMDLKQINNMKTVHISDMKQENLETSDSESQTSLTHDAVDPKTCTPRVFLECFIFPTLLPALEAMLRQAKLEHCFERKRTKFSALDFLTEYLYTQNPHQSDREQKDLWDIPFVTEWLTLHPRQPLPLSLMWTESEAATVIQSHWRGYKVRIESEIQELRQWQREWRQYNGSIGKTVTQFWERKITKLVPAEQLADALSPSDDSLQTG